MEEEIRKLKKKIHDIEYHIKFREESLLSVRKKQVELDKEENNHLNSLGKFRVELVDTKEKLERLLHNMLTEGNSKKLTEFFFGDNIKTAIDLIMKT